MKTGRNPQPTSELPTEEDETIAFIVEHFEKQDQKYPKKLEPFPLLLDQRKPIPYTGKMAEHRFARVITEYLQSIGAEPLTCLHMDYPDHIGWTISFDSKVVVRYELSLNANQEVCVELTAVLGSVPPTAERKSELMEYLLLKNCHANFPVALAIDEQETVTVLFKSNTVWVNDNYFELLVHSLGVIASKMHDELVEAELMVSLHPAYFKVYREVA